jgi:DNA-binding SARP family transcriptional activator/tetratricopeptide (TPR) repeat protein
LSRSSAAHPAETLSSARVRLCGPLMLEAGGREIALRGRQARLIVAFLTWNRQRPTGRDELIELLWPRDTPAEPDEVLSALLSKLRRALGPGALEGRRELTLAFGADAWVDLEAARAEVDRAEAAFERDAWLDVCRVGHDVLDLTAAPFLLGHDHPWVEERRREIEEMRLRTLERMGTAGLALGGSGIGAAERCGREIVDASPFRESGHRLLMEALVARGNVAEALRAYESLRVRLRDELGTTPGAPLRELHTQLLSEEPPASAAPLRDEHKLVTVVATDGAVIEPAEGTVVTAGADACVAVFGVPRAHEDDAERAVRAALESGARAAVVSGEVLVRSGRPAGDPLERAAVLLDAAPPGGVLVDEFTARLTEHAVDYQRSGPAFRPLRLRTRPRAPRTSFVGREHELAVLERLHRTVVEEGRPRLVVVVGDAGAGKSRLVEELLRRIAVAEPDASIHGGRCLAYGDGLTYWPLRELLWSIAGIALDDSAAAAAGKLRALVDEMAEEPERTAHALAISAGITMPGNPLERLEPESVADEVGLAWPRFASGLAAHAPAVKLIEDLHWAEPALLDMVEQLVARSTGPLLIVATARPELLEVRPSWARTATQLTLEPLTQAETRSLVAELLPDAAPALHERVVAAAEGNPFFAEELANHLIDHGPVTDVPIPTTVRAVLAARVDGLPAAEKRALQDAAVVGRSFWASSLPATGAGPLRALEDRGLVITRPTSSLPGQTELSFRHALIREVAYRSIPAPQLEAAHAGVGDWLAGLAGDRRVEFVELLAHHYEAGGEPVRDKAVAALLEAGDGARRRAAMVDAVQFADRALALARPDAGRVAAFELKARALHASVRSDEALTAYLEALALANDDVTIGRLRAHAVLMCARYPGAFTRTDWKDWAVGAIDAGLAADADDFNTAALLVGRASMGRWFHLAPDEQRQAREAAERAVEIAERIGSTFLLSHALEALGWRDADYGFCEAGETADRMLALVGRMSDRSEIGETMVVASVCLLRAGRHAEAWEAATEVAQRSADLSTHRRLHAAAAQAACLVPAGRLAELADATAATLDWITEEGDHACAMATFGLAGQALARYESLDQAGGNRCAELVETIGLHRNDSAFRMLGIELLRPFVSFECTRRRIEASDELRGLVEGVHHTRAQLQLVALEGSDPIDEMAAHARELAARACAPALGWIADWAQAVRAGSLEGALAATGALDRYGEHYTAARLEVDALSRMPDAAAAAMTATRLEQMGALASAAELSGIRGD